MSNERNSGCLGYIEDRCYPIMWDLKQKTVSRMCKDHYINEYHGKEEGLFPDSSRLTTCVFFLGGI